MNCSLEPNNCGPAALAGARPSTGWKARIARQFGKPEGWQGRLAGRLMAWKNRARSEWVLSLLDVGEADRVLEIGFGSGRDLERVHRLASGGLSAGIDHSDEMVRMARRRNMGAIQAGRSDIREATADRIPFGVESFTKAFAINSVQFWPDRRAGFEEIRRVLRPGGLVAIALQPRGTSTRKSAMENGAMLASELSEAGFRDARLETAVFGKVTTVCALGFKAS